MIKREWILLIIIGGFLLASLGLSAMAQAEDAEKPGLVIYAYDSFVSEWGPAGRVIPKFEEQHGIKVSIISVGDAGQVLSRAILEKENPRADIIVGIDNNLLSRALEEDILEVYKSANIELIPEELLFDPSFHVTPFDYGYFAFVYDSQVLKRIPERLEDLTAVEYRNKIILEDPRTSSPGLGFLLWTVAVFGDDYLTYWQQLKPNLLTITDGWDSAYGMFTGGEAPIVLSYTTSPAYHVEYEDSRRYRALIFERGNYRQIEGMAILKGAPNRETGREFIDFILTEEFQKEIPLTNWMYPVNPRVKLPESFKFAPKPRTSLFLSAEEIDKNRDLWLKNWARLISR